mmetsp:Transcript_17966/g.51458  ORF Transcript_17966/g.51458 Transcript_17966/m.51458 type:complete len:224 (+) Transcript_17966:58-729(+)
MLLSSPSIATRIRSVAVVGRCCRRRHGRHGRCSTRYIAPPIVGAGSAIVIVSTRPRTGTIRTVHCKAVLNIGRHLFHSPSHSLPQPVPSCSGSGCCTGAIRRWSFRHRLPPFHGLPSPFFVSNAIDAPPMYRLHQVDTRPTAHNTPDETAGSSEGSPGDTSRVLSELGPDDGADYGSDHRRNACRGGEFLLGEGRYECIKFCGIRAICGVGITTIGGGVIGAR